MILFTLRCLAMERSDIGLQKFFKIEEEKFYTADVSNILFN